jgi:hypothetical protein
MNDQAASALGNISVWAWVLYGIAGALIGGLFTAGLVLAALWWRDVAVIAWQLSRSYLRRRKLVNAIAKIDGATRPMDLGGLVIHYPGVVSQEMEPVFREMAERLRAVTSDDITQPIDPDPALGCPCCPGARSNDCTCRRPCGDPVCQAIDPAECCTWCSLLVWQWPCTCDRACGDPACVPAVRHG